jgi:diguanylate cyclase (GGDEF)-like protein
MGGSPEFLRDFLAGAIRLSGARAATVYVPRLRRRSKAILLHIGELAPLPELANAERASDFAGATAARVCSHSVLGWEGAVPSTSPDGLLIPLPSLLAMRNPTANPRDELADSRDEPGTVASVEGSSDEIETTAWLGLRFASAAEAKAQLGSCPRPAPQTQHRIPPHQEWDWLLGAGGSIAFYHQLVADLLYDPVSGLPGRAHLENFLAEELEAARSGGWPVSLLLLNPDGFREINERFGRETGDAVIREIADCLRLAARREDIVVRFGGAIFACVLPGAGSSAAEQLAVKLQTELAQRIYLDGAIRLEFCGGVSTFSPERLEIHEPLDLIWQANQALAAAKSSEEACIRVWDPGAAVRQSNGILSSPEVFTGSANRDYRNMVMLWETLVVVAAHTEVGPMSAQVIERLRSVIQPDRIALFGVSRAGTFQLLDCLPKMADGSGCQGLNMALLERARGEGGPIKEVRRLARSVGEGKREAATYAFPLTAGGNCHGCLVFEGPGDLLALDNSDFVFLQALASQLGVALDRARLADQERSRLETERLTIRAELDDLRRGLKHVGLNYQSAQMADLLTAIRQIAPTDATVLITGESGTGKELVARTIHELSPRRNAPLVIVDLGSLPTTLIDSELFGHERGSFTGAQERTVGRLALADGATVLLDEISELPLEFQSKLLRFVDDKTLVSVGGVRHRAVDVRILAATNRNLEQEVAAGRFREDLFFRLNVVRLQVPPLRQRPDDILHLARFFLERFAGGYHRQARSFLPEAEARMLEYSWPGNVRELQNRIRQAVILCRGARLSSADLGLGAHGVSFGRFVDQPEQAPDGLSKSGRRAEASGLLDVSPPETPLPSPGLPPGSTSESPWDALRSALAVQVEVSLGRGPGGSLPLGKWLDDDLVLEAQQVAKETGQPGAAVVGLPRTTFSRRLARAQAAQSAGLSFRLDSWRQVRSAIAFLARAVSPDERTALFESAGQVLLEEVFKRAGDDEVTAAALVGVTTITLRRRVAKLLQGRPRLR